MTDAAAPAGAPLPLAPAPDAGDAAAAAELRRVAEEFESIFLAQMLAPMFAGLDTEGLGGGGLGEEMFRPMLIEQYAAAISQAGGIGLADSVVREFMRLQSTPPTGDAP
jgi:Rod binding domain-containing protein